MSDDNDTAITHLESSAQPSDNSSFYLEFAKYASAREMKRRDFEWKMSIGFWAALTTPLWSDSYQTSRMFDMFEKLGVIANLAFAVIALVVYSGVWLYPLWRANQNDKKLMEFGWKTALSEKDSLMDIPDFVPGEYPYPVPGCSGCFLRSPFVWSHIAFTGFFLLLFVAAHTASQ